MAEGQGVEQIPEGVGGPGVHRALRREARPLEALQVRDGHPRARAEGVRGEGLDGQVPEEGGGRPGGGLRLLRRLQRHVRLAAPHPAGAGPPEVQGRDPALLRFQGPQGGRREEGRRCRRRQVRGGHRGRRREGRDVQHARLPRCPLAGASVPRRPGAVQVGHVLALRPLHAAGQPRGAGLLRMAARHVRPHEVGLVAHRRDDVQGPVPHAQGPGADAPHRGGPVQRRRDPDLRVPRHGQEGPVELQAGRHRPPHREQRRAHRRH
mmetsp:Transcript_49054/g.129675  ORF Transcript_49054/g.129675 Transcript_49054/m.129675 type:complete len:265 (-) Transcript_49054:603-1397(-)